MTHDPLCLAADGEPCLQHGTPACPCDCQCDLLAKVRADQQPTDVNAWLAIGIGHGWVSKPVCSTHDRIPTSEREEGEWDAGHDPCAPVVRIWADGLPAS